MNIIYGSLVYLVIIQEKVMSKQCEGFFANGVEDEGSDSGVTHLNCPQPGQQQHFTECCAGAELSCCPAATFLQQMDSQLVMGVALLVMACCMLLIVLVLVCCFSSHCPLYNACRVNYTQGGIIAYAAKEEEPLTQNMPLDWAGQKCYSPNVAVKMKRMPEDV